MEVNRRAHYGWMALGGLLCLFGIVAFCRWRDSSRALAQDPVPLPPISAPEQKSPAAEVLPAGATEPLTPPPATPTPPPTITPKLGSDPRPIVIPPSSPAPPSAPVTPPASPADMTPPSLPVKPPEVKEGVTPVRSETPKDHPGEPPLAPSPGPVVTYRLPRSGETFRSLAKKTLGSADRWSEIHKLNPTIKADASLVAGSVVRLPADACVTEDSETVHPLPSLRARPLAKSKQVLPLTGTYPLTLDDTNGLTLPKAVLSQLGNPDTVLLSPGSDKCLWLTNQAHLDRLAAKLDKSPARESDIRTFKRLFYAQVAKLTVKDGRVLITERFAQFANLHQEVILVGIDDHFEVWDAARWRRYTQTKKGRSDE